MTNRRILLTALGSALAIGLSAMAPTPATGQEAAPSPLRLVSSRVSLAGTSNIHAYTASSTAARLVRVQVANGVLGANVWDAILKPGALEAFELSIPAATLSSPKEGLDKNMHKALKTAEHPDITFRLSRLEVFGVLERAEGKASAEASERVWKQYAVDTVYRFLPDESLFVGVRYNKAKGTLAGIDGDVGADRWQVGGGWFITPHILAKAEYVNQKYFGYPTTNIRNGGKFNGMMLEGVVAF